MGFTCEYCEKKFSRRQNLTYHVVLHGINNVPSNFTGGRKTPLRNVLDQTTIRNEGSLTDYTLLKQELINIGKNAIKRVDNSIKWTIAYDVIFVKGEERTQPHPTFQDAAYISLNEEDVRQVVNKSIVECDKDIETFTHNGSGWRFIGLDRVVVTVYDYNPARGRSYIPTPPVLASKKAIVNVQNTDNKCFMWSILAALYPPVKDAQRVMKYRDHVGKLNCDMLEFSVKHTSSKISQFEDVNTVSINIYRYDPKYKAMPLRVSKKQSRDNVIDLLVLEDKDGNTHYTWLKNMSHLMHGSIGHKRTGKKVYCKRCLKGFRTTAKLDDHKVVCTDKGFVQRSVFPTEENKMLQFTNYKKKWLLPSVIYADMECKQEESDEENVISKHTPISIAYSVVSIDPKWKRECWVYTGDDCVQQFLLSLDKLKLVLSDVLTVQLPIKPLSHVQQEEHNNAAKCYLCQKQFNETEETARKHADHCHITGEYCGPACQY